MPSERHPYRLPPRLRTKADFRRVGRLGRHLRLAFLHLTFCPTSSRDGSPFGRVGFTISDRVSKLATRRNRVRRLLKEAVRLWWGEIRPGHDLVLSISRLPEIDHARYVETVFLKLLLDADLLVERGRIAALSRLTELTANRKGE
jgi:ribonuclease P protein component